MVGIGRTTPVGPVGGVAAPATARQQDLERALSGQIGKTMRADVVGKLSDGSYLVKVADQTARMLLPASTQPGSAVSLTLVAITPRPAFRLDPSVTGQGPAVVYADADDGRGLAAPALPSAAPDGAARVNIDAATMARARAQAQLPGGIADGADGADGAGETGNSGAPTAAQGPRSHAAVLLSRAPLTAAAQLPTLDAKTMPAQLSAGGRVLAEVLASAARNPDPPTAVTGPSPLLDPAVPVDARHLAQMLKDALGRSGLFYESHLQEWSAGKRELADIAREPQMQSAARGQPPGNPATDPVSAGFVNMQLETQEQGRMMWMGQLMPGQNLAWQVERDEGRPGNGAGEDESAWRSGLTLRFAGLGEIGATVVLSGGHVHVSLSAGSEDTAAVLRSHAGSLGDKLDAAGARLGSLTVRGGASDA